MIFYFLFLEIVFIYKILNAKPTKIESFKIYIYFFNKK